MTTNALVRSTLGVALFAALSANAIQPVEVGLQPVRDQIQTVQRNMYALAEQFASDDKTQTERNLVGRRLVELMTERKALQAEVGQARAMSRSPLILYVTPSSESK